MSTIVSLKHVKKSFSHQPVLRDVSFTIEEGAFVAITGSSGCGKSTLLNLIGLLDRPDAGELTLFGRSNISPFSARAQRLLKEQIGYLFQNYALFPNLTVLENICFSLKKKDRAGQAYARELLERFYLTEVADSYPAVLSGGQQQRTAMARMLAAKPRVLLLDEPFSALDSFLRREMEREVQEVLNNFGGVSILVSHNKEEIRRMTRRCMVMEQGKIAEIGKTEEIFAHPCSEEGKLLISGG